VGKDAGKIQTVNAKDPAYLTKYTGSSTHSLCLEGEHAHPKYAVREMRVEGEG
jgi:hypothetical protein